VARTACPDGGGRRLYLGDAPGDREHGETFVVPEAGEVPFRLG
jgi:hypothetical protein